MRSSTRLASILVSLLFACDAPAVQDAAIKRAPDAPITSPETADLLEALRRRRGQRTAAPTDETQHEERRIAPVTPVSLFDAQEPKAPEPAPQQSAGPQQSAPSPRPEGQEPSRRKGRTSMPSWDEIVFGARTDEN